METEFEREVLERSYLSDENVELWMKYLKVKKYYYKGLSEKLADASALSEANWIVRKEMMSCEEGGIDVQVGDICYIDFGQAYLNEAGYQHFGVVMAICHKKALVIPMTSNPLQYENAYDDENNPLGKIHLLKIGQPKGLNKPSVLFMNDAKFINTARIIGVKSHIPEKSPLFRKIQQRLLRVMFYE